MAVSKTRKAPARPGRGVTQALTILGALVLLGACQPDREGELRAFAKAHGLRPIAKPAPQVPAQVELGRMLFFDPVLSGRCDTSCATCHHPRHGTADARPLPAGVGGEGLGPKRTLEPGRPLIARHAPPLFNLSDPAWRTQMWDMRVVRLQDGTMSLPVTGTLPGLLTNLLAAQAMLPVTARDEMRGERGEADVRGAPNELGALFSSQQARIWTSVMDRVLKIPRYRELFARAFPKTSLEELGFEHAALAMASFETAAFSPQDTPWDRFLRGERGLLSPKALRGAALFFGEAKCATCHSGPLFTDQRAHNIAAPQLGPGKPPEEPLDYGRERLTMNPQERFAFRTPPLRQLVHTAPYTHAGALATLEDVVRHHMDPARSLRAYTGEHLEPELRATLVRTPELLDATLSTLDPALLEPSRWEDAQVGELVAFLEALSSPSLASLMEQVPDAVPSGLPVD